MEISDCLKKPCCYHLCNHRCGEYSLGVAAPNCVHGIVKDGNLAVMYGRDIYKIIDKNHVLYEHFYHLHDKNYLDKKPPQMKN
jgi:hypothetical protein